jgi:hypothetical protein
MLLYILLICLILYFYKNNVDNFENTNNKICCLFAYYEKNDMYKENLNFFLNNGIYDEIDYYIIINDKCTLTLSNKPNIKILYKENKGYDFGAYSYALKTINKKYDYYTFINSSVRGPYFKNINIKWYEPFLKLFVNNVKLVGTTINIYSLNTFYNYNLKDYYNHTAPFPHVQSMFFMIDNEYFNYLQKINFFNEEKLNNITNINEVILYYEFGLSQIALKNNWNINSILEPYKNLDYINIKKDINNTSVNGDPYYTNSYFGKTIDPYDVIFFKNNRFV